MDTIPIEVKVIILNKKSCKSFWLVNHEFLSIFKRTRDILCQQYSKHIDVEYTLTDSEIPLVPNHDAASSIL